MEAVERPLSFLNIFQAKLGVAKLGCVQPDGLGDVNREAEQEAESMVSQVLLRDQTLMGGFACQLLDFSRYRGTHGDKPKRERPGR